MTWIFFDMKPLFLKTRPNLKGKPKKAEAKAYLMIIATLVWMQLSFLKERTNLGHWPRGLGLAARSGLTLPGIENSQDFPQSLPDLLQLRKTCSLRYGEGQRSLFTLGVSA